MKINKVHNAYERIINTSIPKEKEDKSKDMNIKENKSANVQISTSAKELIKKINEHEESGFSEKVEKIRQAVLEGKYKVSSEKIAHKILDSIESQEGKEI